MSVFNPIAMNHNTGGGTTLFRLRYYDSQRQNTMTSLIDFFL